MSCNCGFVKLVRLTAVESSVLLFVTFNIMLLTLLIDVLVNVAVVVASAPYWLS